MSTYYKYAERNVDSQVNWGEIGKNMTDMLASENKIREDKKAALDEASRQYGLNLSEPPQGTNTSLNSYALKYADDAQSARLLQDRLLRGGILKPRDYVLQRQNLTDGTSGLFNVMKDYQTEYGVKMERYKTDKSQDLEQWLMAQAEGFANFNNSKPVINPTDYTLSIAKMVKNEKTGVMEMDKDPNSFTTVAGLQNRIKATFDKFDVPQTLNGFVKTIGKQLDAVKLVGSETRTGSITETLDISKRKGFGKYAGVLDNFEKAETAALKSYLTNPYNTSSVLTNSLGLAPNGERYTFSYKPEDIKPGGNIILLKDDGKTGTPMPNFTPEQETAALEHLRTQARLMYDKTTNIQAVTEPRKREPNEWEYNAAQKAKENLTAAGAWNQVYTGKTPAEKQSALNILLGTPHARALGLQAIDLDKNGVLNLKYEDPSKNRTIKYLDENGKPISGSDWAAIGTELTGEADRNKAIRAGGGLAGGYGGNVSELISAKRTGPTVETPANEKYKQIVTGTPVSTKGKEDTVIPDLQAKFGDFGFTFEPSGYWGTNNVKITSPDKLTSIVVGLNNKNEQDELDANQKIKQFLSTNMTEAKLKEIPASTLGGSMSKY